jgi:hypothetical protein
MVKTSFFPCHSLNKNGSRCPCRIVKTTRTVKWFAGLYFVFIMFLYIQAFNERPLL